jgi:hypothetical protein
MSATTTATITFQDGHVVTAKLVSDFGTSTGKVSYFGDVSRLRFAPKEVDPDYLKLMWEKENAINGEKCTFDTLGQYILR